MTAQLLLLIEERMRRLPLVTLEAIYALSGQTGMDTSRFIQSVMEEMREQPQPLNEELEIIDGISFSKICCWSTSETVLMIAGFSGVAK